MSLIKDYITENINTKSVNQIARELNLSVDNVIMRVKRLNKPKVKLHTASAPKIVKVNEPAGFTEIQPNYTDIHTGYANEIAALVNFIQVNGEGVWVDIAKRKLRELELTP